jgi:hypothetical protein
VESKEARKWLDIKPQLKGRLTGRTLERTACDQFVSHRHHIAAKTLHRSRQKSCLFVIVQMLRWDGDAADDEDLHSEPGCWLQNEQGISHIPVGMEE